MSKRRLPAEFNGVYKDGVTGMWYAFLYVPSKHTSSGERRVNLGLFPEVEEAEAAVEKAQARYPDWIRHPKQSARKMRKRQGAVTQAELKHLFTYDPKTGHLLWKRTKARARMGEPAGSFSSSGTRQIGIRGKLYYAHNLVWLYHYGTWPKRWLEHLNGDKTDTRIENLRERDPLFPEQPQPTQPDDTDDTDDTARATVSASSLGF